MECVVGCSVGALGGSHSAGSSICATDIQQVNCAPGPVLGTGELRGKARAALVKSPFWLEAHSNHRLLSQPWAAGPQDEQMWIMAEISRG